MIISLDTRIFFKDFRMTRAGFQFFEMYLESNEDVQLVIPELIVEEVLDAYVSSVKRISARIREGLAMLESRLGRPMGPKADLDMETLREEYRSYFVQRIEAMGGVILPTSRPAEFLAPLLPEKAGKRDLYIRASLENHRIALLIHNLLEAREDMKEDAILLITRSDARYLSASRRRLSFPIRRMLEERGLEESVLKVMDELEDPIWDIVTNGFESVKNPISMLQQETDLKDEGGGLHDWLESHADLVVAELMQTLPYVFGDLDLGIVQETFLAELTGCDRSRTHLQRLYSYKENQRLAFYEAHLLFDASFYAQNGCGGAIHEVLPRFPDNTRVVAVDRYGGYMESLLELPVHIILIYDPALKKVNNFRLSFPHVAGFCPSCGEAWPRGELETCPKCGRPIDQ